MRISVKDNYNVAGITTKLGIRAFAELYGQQRQTAEIVRRLVDLGASVVGQTKLGAYAGSEVPPEKCIDYFPPWNPRGDSYQGPSGSSSGAGSSIASYDWLDLSLATDSKWAIFTYIGTSLNVAASNGKYPYASRVLRPLGYSNHLGGTLVEGCRTCCQV